MHYFAEDADTDRKCLNCDYRLYSCVCRPDLPPVDMEKDPIVTAPVSKPALSPAVKFDGSPLDPSSYDPDIDFIFPEPAAKPPAAGCVDSMIRETYEVGNRRATIYVWHLEPRRFTGAFTSINAAKLVTGQRFYVPDVDWKKNIHPVVLISTDDLAYLLAPGGRLVGPMSKSEALRAILP